MQSPGFDHGLAAADVPVLPWPGSPGGHRRRATQPRPQPV